MSTNGVCHITFTGDVVLKLRFGIPATRMFSEMLASEEYNAFFEGGKLTEIGTAKLIYFGYQNELLVSEEPKKYALVDFVEYVEKKTLDKDMKELQEVVNVFSDTRSAKMLTEKIVEGAEEIKKKLNGQMSKPQHSNGSVGQGNTIIKQPSTTISMHSKSSSAKGKKK